MAHYTISADGECCCGGGPCCTSSWPDTIYATFTSSCSEWNGQVVPLVWEGSGVWHGKYEGSTNDCDVEISVNCSNGVSPTVVDFIIGLGTGSTSGYYETPDCDPVSLAFGLVNGEEELCCAGANLDVVVTD